MIETLSEGLSKCRWLCAIILIAFSIESMECHELTKKALSEYITNNDIITVINSTLTGVVILSLCVLAIQILKIEKEDNPVSITSIIQLADFKSVAEWTILFKWAFVLLQYNISNSELWNCITDGWHPVYLVPIVIVAIPNVLRHRKNNI